MSGFKLYSLEINNKLINTEKIQLINEYNPNSDNYYSLIIGNNGTGKSRILSEIAKFFNSQNNGKLQLFKEPNFQYNKIPSKIIAITNSISDKFPVDKSFRPSLHSSQEIYHRDFIYNYLGTRNSVNSFSSRALMNRALEIVFESYSELDVSRNYRHIFDYLDYEPIIKLNYSFSRSVFRLVPYINQATLIEYVEKESRNRFSIKSEFLRNIISERGKEICNFIINKLQNDTNESELTINFSEKNISRIRGNNSLYSDNVYEYELISILRKIGFISSFNIQVFKKGGAPFNFKDASSGEANILSTLLSLIPLLKNDSLILIDEPEISLHPQWQSKYVDLLNKILDSVTGCHIIIASHSPFLASNLKPNNSSVISLRNRKGTIYGKSIDKSTYGWSSEDILLNVFEMESTRNYKLNEYVSKALALLANNNRSKQDLTRIQNKLQEFYPFILENDPMKSVIKAIFEVKVDE